jgi:hypothetical protein
MTGRRGIGSLCAALAALLLPACTGLLGTEAVIDAHAVFLTRDGCPYFVTNLTRNSFAVLAAPAEFDPRQGDLLVGDLNEGVRSLEVVPFGEQDIARTLSFEVAGHGLSLEEAQDLYYGFCPLPPGEIPPGTPSLPLAPDATDDGVPPGEVRPETPPDTAGVF